MWDYTFQSHMIDEEHYILKALKNEEVVAESDITPIKDMAYLKLNGLWITAHPNSTQFGEAWIFVSVEQIKNYVKQNT